METTLNLDEDVAAALQERAEVLHISFEQAANDVFRVWFDLTAPVERQADNETGETELQTGVDPLKYNRLDSELMMEDYVAKEMRSR